MNSTKLDKCITKAFPVDCSFPPEECIPYDVIFNGFMTSGISGIGIVFNMASLIILFDPPSIDLFEQLLISLAFCDLTFCSKFH